MHLFLHTIHSSARVCVPLRHAAFFNSALSCLSFQRLGTHSLALIKPLHTALRSAFTRLAMSEPDARYLCIYPVIL